MQEDKGYTDRTDDTDGKEVDPEERPFQSSSVGELIMYYFLGDIPAYKQTGKHSTHGQQEVCCQTVTEVHQRETHEFQFWISPYREGAEDTDDTCNNSEHPCRLLPGHFKLLSEEGSTYLMHGDSGGQCRKHQ